MLTQDTGRQLKGLKCMPSMHGTPGSILGRAKIVVLIIEEHLLYRGHVDPPLGHQNIPRPKVKKKFINR